MSAACADMVQAAATSTSARKTKLPITQLHQRNGRDPPARGRLGYGIPLFSCKIYREF
jgi:hypothetical protein